MGNSKLNKLLTKTLSQWQLQKNKLSKVSSTKFGRPMTSTRAELSTRKRPRNSFRTPSVTSDLVMNSPMRPSTRYSPLSTRITPEPLRRAKWSSSSSNFLVETESDLNDQDSHNEDQRQRVEIEAR